MNLAASEWIDEYGLTWLATTPKIRLLPDTEKRQPYPLSWEEQARLFKQLPSHLAEMALFAVNTGCRVGEVCGLRWEGEFDIPAYDTSVFLIPGRYVKNADDRLVVLNRIAASVVEARVKAGLKQVRVHDLKHTFGRRLRAAGVSFEDRQDLLGHRSGRITTHYSAAELSRLIESA